MNLHVYPTVQQMGAAAAAHLARRIRELARRYEVVPIVFATGASQLETLRALTALPDVPWQQVAGFHLDEYVGIPRDHPASFRNYLRAELTSKAPLRAFYEIDADAADAGEISLQYAGLLREFDPLLALVGIGENGHLAFNDPDMADFSDPADVKIADLDQACRQQQVNEGWFSSLEDVPRRAITVTIPALLRIPELVVSVPGERKRAALTRTFHDPISTACPATVLRTHDNVELYTDKQAWPGLNRPLQRRPRSG